MNDDTAPTGEPRHKLSRDQVLAILEAARAAGEPADLAGTDLSGIDLSGENLKKADLTKANLAKANLAKANLAGANLDFSKMAGANLAGADLTDASAAAELQGADLSYAVLSGATLDFAQLQDANLTGALLDDEAALRSADLSGANLSRAILWGTHIQRANLTGADLSGADMTGAFLEDTVMPDGETYYVGMSLSQRYDATLRDFPVHTLQYPFSRPQPPKPAVEGRPPAAPAETPPKLTPHEPVTRAAPAPAAPAAPEPSAPETPPPACPNCANSGFSCEPKLFYERTNRPVKRFFDLFTGGFMTVLGIVLLWLVFSVRKSAQSGYVLISGLGLLLGGVGQLIRYFASAKVVKYACKCRNCRHQWQLSESEGAQVAAYRAAPGQSPPAKPSRRKWLWWAIPAALVLFLACGIGGSGILAALLRATNAPEKQPTPIAATVVVTEVLVRPTDTPTTAPPTPTQPLPTHTPTATHTPVPPTDTPTHTAVPPTPTPAPTETSTATPKPTDSAPSLPGTETIPLRRMGSRIPWLPTDASNMPTVYFYCFNVTKAPFDDRLVRQALALAVDRRIIAAMATKAGFRQVQPATVFTPPGVLGRDLNEEVGLDLDLDRARELLAQAGYPGGSGLPQFTLTYNYTGATGNMNRDVANAMAEMWREGLGLDVEVEAVDDWEVYVEQLSTDAPQVFRMAWRGAEIDPDYYLAPPFYSRGAYNYAQLADPEFDALIERAGTSDDPAERQALYVQAEQELVEHEAVIIPLFHYISAN